jgi:hypothetical protein
MSALILPSRFTSQPQYPAPIEKGNDLARALAFLWNAANPSFESVTGAPVTTNNATTAISNRGKVLKSSAGQVNTEWARQFITTSDGVGTGDFTFATLANPSAAGSGAVEHLFAQKNDAGGAPYCQTGLLAHYFGGGYGSGGIVFLTYGSAPVECVTTGVMDGGYHMWVCRRVGTSYRLFKDGVSIASTTATAINILQSPTRYTAIGSRGNGTTESYRDSTVMAASWNRALTDNEVVQLTSNYWSLFKAPTRFYFAPSGGGGGATAYTLTCATGSYVTSGKAATLTLARKLICATGAYTTSGKAATLTVGRKLALAVGAYTTSGKAATLTYVPGAGPVARTLTCDAGSYTFSGKAATLTVNRKLSLAVGAYTTSGKAATLTVAHSLQCATGAYVVSGKNATLTYVSLGPIAYTLTCAKGSYIVSGKAATLTYVGYIVNISDPEYTVYLEARPFKTTLGKRTFRIKS